MTANSAPALGDWDGDGDGDGVGVGVIITAFLESGLIVFLACFESIAIMK